MVNFIEHILTALRHLASIELSLKEIATAMRERPTPPTPASDKSEPTGWRAFVIPFGKQNGERLGDISEKSLEWWIANYQPKPFFTSNGEERPPSKRDLALRKALDEARAELTGTPLVPSSSPASADSRPADGARPPFPSRQSSKAPSDAHNEDVPF